VSPRAAFPAVRAVGPLGAGADRRGPAGRRYGAPHRRARRAGIRV